MRVVLQRVSRAAVSVDGVVMASIGPGFLLLVGVAEGDGEADANAVVDKIAGLRVFSDRAGKMNLSIGDVAGEILVVSQFTLLGDARKGRRPSFTGAADSAMAAPMIDDMVARFRAAGIPTLSGVFGATMEVELVNEGPVTLVLDVSDGRLG